MSRVHARVHMPTVRRVLIALALVMLACTCAQARMTMPHGGGASRGGEHPRASRSVHESREEPRAR
jgi:hypothetical protein